MAGGRTSVNGTKYTIERGRTSVRGTKYTIEKGRTSVNGTKYNIVFKDLTINGLISNMSIKAIHGSDHANNSPSSPGSIFIVPPAAGTYYAFGVSGNWMSIAKCVCIGSKNKWDITVTELKHVQTSAGGSMEIAVTANNSYIYLDAFALSDDDIRGTLILAQFTDYTVAEVDSLISASSSAVVAGRYKDSRANIYTTASSLVGKVSIFATGQSMAFNYFSSATSYTTLQSSESEGYASGLVYINSSEANAYVSYDGTSAASCRTGTIATI